MISPSASTNRASPPQAAPSALRDHVARAVRKFLVDLRDAECGNLYGLVMQEVEAPLYAEVLRHCDGNLTRAAGVLGINRATLRKRLRELGIAD